MSGYANTIYDAVARVTIPEGKFGYLLKNPSKSGVFKDSMGFDQAGLDSALRSHLTTNFGNAMSAVMTDETFILGDRIYDVRVSPAEDLRTAVVTVTLDGRFEWSLTVPGWRGVSLGASRDTGYLWSARELVVLPRASDAELQVIRVDEDLLSAFRLDDGWLVVCETSIRRLVGQVETARVELGDVVEVVRWEGGVLLVRDAAGEDLALRVDGEQMAV